MKANNKKFGFTLIELLIAMVILGILTMIAASSFTNTRVKARDAKRKSNLEQVQKALEMFYNDNERYRTQLEGVPFGNEWIKDKNGATETIYMAMVPGSASEYCYESDIGGLYYRLFAILENDNDLAITESGCEAGCSCGGTEYNYQVTSPNYVDE